MHLSCLRDDDRLVTIDASVAINLAATGAAARIASALRVRLAIPREAMREIEVGAVQGHDESAVLRRLIEDGHVAATEMSAEALGVFAELVAGTVSQSLGDGEAATIAISHVDGSLAAIDEKKARIISGQRFPELRIASSIDLLSHARVMEALGRDDLAVATLNALKFARMHVQEHQFDWVLDLIGETQAAGCGSLRRLLKAKSRPLRRTG